MLTPPLKRQKGSKLLKTVRKSYSKDLDNLMGKPAERAIVRKLKANKIVEEITQFPFGELDVDLRIVYRGRTFFADVEGRGGLGWPMTFKNFPYRVIHVPARKEHMIRTRVPFLYYVVRSDLKRAAMLRGESILESPKKRHENKFARKGDTMFAVPRDLIVRYENL